MSWNAIVSGTTLDAFYRPRDLVVEPFVGDGHDRHIPGSIVVRRIVRRLGGDAGQRREQRRLAGVGRMPTIPTFIIPAHRLGQGAAHSRTSGDTRAQHGAGEHVARVVHAQVEADSPRTMSLPRRAAVPAPASGYARAAANEVVA